MKRESLNIQRTDFLEDLKRAAPALSVKGLVPSFGCFFFSDGKALAYDDVVAIESNLSGPVTVDGGIQGKMLTDYLTASRAKDVLFTEEDGICTIKASRAKLKLPLLPMKDLMFEWPDADDAASIPVTDEFMAALSAAYTSIGLDPSMSWCLGITLVFGNKKATMFSTDNYTLTMSEVKLKPGKLKGLETILPPRFCELVLAKGRPDELVLTQYWVEARYEDETRIWSKTLSDMDPDRFREVLADVNWKRGFYKVPKGLDGCLNRALVVLDKAEDQHIDAYVKDNKMRFFGKGPVGEFRDFLRIPGHPAARVRVRPALMKRALPHATEMKISSGSCVAFHAAGYCHMVNVVQE